jgi:hypothetical protein
MHASGTTFRWLRSAISNFQDVQSGGRSPRIELEVALNDCPRASLRDVGSVRRFDLNVDLVGAATLAANGPAGQNSLAILVTKDGTPRLVRGKLR